MLSNFRSQIKQDHAEMQEFNVLRFVWINLASFCVLLEAQIKPCGNASISCTQTFSWINLASLCVFWFRSTNQITIHLIIVINPAFSWMSVFSSPSTQWVFSIAPIIRTDISIYPSLWIVFHIIGRNPNTVPTVPSVTNGWSPRCSDVRYQWVDFTKAHKVQEL